MLVAALSTQSGSRMARALALYRREAPGVRLHVHAPDDALRYMGTLDIWDGAIESAPLAPPPPAPAGIRP